MTQDKRQELTENQRSLLEAIEGLASVYAQKEICLPESTWKFWFDAVKQSTLADVRKAIGDWGKASSKMMTPADLFKALQNARSLKRDAKSIGEQHENKPLAPELMAKFESEVRKVANRNLHPTVWAVRAMIKEAYGFGLYSIVRESWRKALNKDDGYNFEDTDGVFPLDDSPNERSMFNHDEANAFMKEYEQRHGLMLVYDRELAYKRYANGSAA